MFNILFPRLSLQNKCWQSTISATRQINDLRFFWFNDQFFFPRNDMLIAWLGLGTKKPLGYGEENITFWLKIPAVVVAKKKNTPQLQIARILVQIYFFCHHKRGLSPSCLQNIQWCDIYKCRNTARPPCRLQLHLRPLNLYTWQSGNKHVLGCEHVCSLHKRLTASVFSWWLGCFPS